MTQNEAIPFGWWKDRAVRIDDELLPAAAYLTGPDAVDVLAPVVAAAGGELLSCRPSNVQYRPQADLVVRYRCEVRSAGGVATEHLLAVTTLAGPPAGTVPVEAVTDDGTIISAGVWKWPFDPVLADLGALVNPATAGALLAPWVGDRPQLDVVVYRPTERAVVRARGPEGEVYVKVVAPASTAALVERHRALRAGGLPVPTVVAHGEGWLAMEALHGSTLRDRLKLGEPLPPPECFSGLMQRLAAVDLGWAPPVRSRVADATHHAAMLATVLPEAAHRLDAIVERIGAGDAAHATATVHGDLHEAQMVVDDHGVIGLLDIDDAGPGDPLDDVGTLLAHLRFRALVGTEQHERIGQYAQRVHASLLAGRDAADIDRHVAAVLVGLSTGPFRLQQDGWQATTMAVLDAIDGLLGT